MRKKDSVAEFDRHRRQALLASFRSALASQSHISTIRAFRMAAEAPAPRFWVSEARAAAVIGAIEGGRKDIASMTPSKRAMYAEIHRRYLQLKAHRPEATIVDIVAEVIDQPAPESYLTWQRTKTILNQELRRMRAERRANLNSHHD